MIKKAVTKTKKAAVTQGQQSTKLSVNDLEEIHIGKTMGIDEKLFVLSTSNLKRPNRNIVIPAVTPEQLTKMYKGAFKFLFKPVTKNKFIGDAI